MGALDIVKEKAAAAARAITARADAVRSDSSMACDVKIADNTDVLLTRLRNVIRDNTMALAVWGVIVLGCALVLMFLASRIIQAVRNYLHHTAARKRVPPKPNVDDAVDDDIKYASDAKADDQLPTETESVYIKSKIGELRDRYGAYNRAISQYIRGKGREPDDIMDKRIMSRADDDFNDEKKDTDEAPGSNPRVPHVNPLHGASKFTRLNKN